MKFSCLFFLTFVAISTAQQNYENGLRNYFTTIRPVVPVYQVTRTKYFSGSGDDGQYHPDDSGAYRPDGAGAYKHDDDPYKHRNGPNGGAAGASGGYGGSGSGYTGENDYRGDGSGQYRPDNSGAYVHSDSPYVHSGNPYVNEGNKQVSSIGDNSGAKPQVSVLKPGNAAGLYDNRNYGIIRKVEHVEQDGYHYLYETENGILGEEEGHLDKKGTENEAMQAKGFFKYTGPDNVVYEVQYVANEDGFQPTGAHLPQAPAIPEAILRALAYQRSIGELKE